MWSALRGRTEGNSDDKVDWQVWVRDADTGKVVAGPLDGHTQLVLALDISPDGRILASGSYDRTVILWDTSTWQRKGDPLLCGACVRCVRFSPIGKLAVATDKDIQIWDLDRRKRLARFKGHHDFNNAWNNSLTWTPDGAQLLSAGSQDDPVIRSWDTSTWQQAGDPWTGHDEDKPIAHIILNPAGTLLASASYDHTVRLWQLPTGTEVARFQHSDGVFRVAFSLDGHSIFGGGGHDHDHDHDHNTNGTEVSQWDIPEQVLAAVRSDPLVNKKIQAGPSLGKQRYMNGFFDPEISTQRRNDSLNHRGINHSTSPRANADPSPYSRLHGFRTFVSGIRWSSDKGKQKAQEVIDVPLGQATYQDVVGVDDGIRPYVLFFCLSWFQKKKKKPDPPRPVYDDELEDDESEEGVLNIPMPTPCKT
ncbi:WD40-repeat-containing domain protein [Suillus lakei]|nr:WD40-repeat-containing domain protein [Suillus lakei]